MKDIQQEADLQALADAFLLLQTESECIAFLKDICTYQELRAMSQRLHVAKMLHQQHVFHEIVQETGASTATISRVNRTLRDSTGGYQTVLERMNEKTE
jgi:TrpR-related protein YerC/YecD